jgi:hypothetical protein
LNRSLARIWDPEVLWLFFYLIVGAFTAVGEAEAGMAVWQWNFDTEPVDQAPSGFTFGRTGSGRLGRWVVQNDKDAPSGGHVLAQLDVDNTSYRFPVAVANEPVLRDLQISVRCKAVTGTVDQACGVVFRYTDENNYYVARANALEDNIRFYYVKSGKRIQLASWSGRVSSGFWHELRVEAQGDRFSVFWDGQNVIEANDKTFPDGGKIGLWTKADSVTYFDNLSTEAR